MLPTGFGPMLKEHGMAIYGKNIHCKKLGCVVAIIYSPTYTALVKSTFIMTSPSINPEQKVSLQTIGLLHGIEVR